MADANSRRTAAAGFSLIEVMVAMAILGFGLLTLAAMQLNALTQGSAGRHTGDASAAARSYLEQVHRLPWATLTAARDNGPWTNVFWPNTTDTVNVSVDVPGGGAAATEHTYTLAWNVTDINACLRNVEIRVSWNEEGRSAPKTLTLATRRYNWGSSGC